MLLLGIDTSGNPGGITLAMGGEGPFQELETSAIQGGTFSAQLVPTISAVLSRHNKRAADLDALIAVSGPGSFTGLRVGLSAVKALAEVLGKPIVAVSLLEVMAALGETRGRVTAVLDAGRNELFLGTYEGREKPGLVKEQILPAGEFAAWLAETRPDSVVLTEDLRGLASSASHRALVFIPRPGSREAARLGAQKLLAGETISPERLDANYIRRSDAEIFSKSR